MTSLLKLEIIVSFLIIRNRSVWPTFFLLNVFTALKGTHLYIFIQIEQVNSDCAESGDGPLALAFLSLRFLLASQILFALN